MRPSEKVNRTCRWWNLSSNEIAVRPKPNALRFAGDAQTRDKNLAVAFALRFGDESRQTVYSPNHSVLLRRGSNC